MGLIKAGLGAVGGNLADQWKEYFYCEAMPENVIAVQGEKRIGGRTSNTKGTDNIISRGSVIAVADGQFMMIVEQGKVVEVCAEPGEFIFDNSTEPSIFAGEFGESLKESFRNIGKRFSWWGTNTALRVRSRSVSWTKMSVWMWISPSNALVSTAIISSIRFASTPMSVPMCRTRITEKASIPSSKPSF